MRISAFLWLFVLIEGGANVALAWFEGVAVDALAYNSFSEQQLLRSMLFLLAAIVVQWVSSVLTPFLFKISCAQHISKLRRRIYSVLISAPVLSVAKVTEGDLSVRLTLDVKAIESFREQTLYVLLRRGCIATLAVTLAFFVDWKFALAEFAVLPFILYMNIKIDSSMDETYCHLSECNSKMSNLLYTIVSQLRVIKSFYAESFFLTRFTSILSEICVKTKDNNFKITRNTIKLSYINMIPIFLHFSIGTALVISGSVTFGKFVLFGMLRRHLNNFLLFLPQFISLRHKNSAAEERIIDILKLSPTRRVNFCATKRATDVVCMHNVGFSYGDKKVFSEATFTCFLGQMTVLVGESGSGKSTLLHVLCGIYPPSEGEIFYAKETLNDKVSAAAFVSQDPFIFSTSVMENIRLGSAASDEEIYELCRRLDIYDAIMKLPNGFETCIGAGGLASLSGGQLQRICIARACVSNATLIGMDEPTSSLDAKNIAMALDVFEVLKKKKAFIIATHNQSIMRHADCILHVCNGRVHKVKDKSLFIKNFIPEQTHTDVPIF
ncbi:ABC transporter, ATP-binding protein [Lancefieldella rimae]|uniref:ABC transporter, ATP-binding protein n=3 Tax=Lancefieldella rimae TaxID=1383 RepID=B9CLD1_LANR4|nr:ABC transporter ATP-binding protein [Lancefieldella rimae]EEE18130.1 ABC transporter, ATP-binding protein [Lancefieldella rimae ATCC 49626]KRO02846.1 ABC transporter, ATP-binding protein [Lancefieldella rimae]